MNTYKNARKIVCIPFSTVLDGMLISDPERNKNIELQFLAKVFRFHMKSGGFHEIRMKSGGFQVKSGGFHEIQWISGEIHPKPCKIRSVFAETSASDF